MNDLTLQKEMADTIHRLRVRLGRIRAAAECLYETAYQTEKPGSPLSAAAKCLMEDIGGIVEGLSGLEDDASKIKRTAGLPCHAIK